jgi:hypothetical protein
VPRYSFTGDDDTGIGWTASNNIDFITGGAQTMGLSANYLYTNNLTLKVAMSSGSATAPTYSFQSDENTGMYRAAADTIGFATGGTYRMSISTTSVEMDTCIAFNPGSTVPLTADNQAVTVGGRSYLRVSSNNATATNRTFTISNGIVLGQTLIIECVGTTTNRCELQDSGNCALAGTWTADINDTISLIWNGTSWCETSRSIN